MVVYNIYIFDNHGTFLFYSEYKRAKKADMSHSEVSFHNFALIIDSIEFDVIFQMK